MDVGILGQTIRFSLGNALIENINIQKTVFLLIP